MDCEKERLAQSKVFSVNLAAGNLLNQMDSKECVIEKKILCEQLACIIMGCLFFKFKIISGSMMQ